MFERYTENARDVMSRARQEAQKFGHDHIGTEHILLGLIEVKTGIAAEILKSRAIDLRHAKEQVEKLVKHGSGGGEIAHGTLSRTEHAQHALNDAVREARALKHKHIGTEHLLLGLLYEKECIATEVLANLNLRLNDIRNDVLHFVQRSENVA